jgi:cobalt-zinc-cadmium resistance protein CzcA
VAGIADLGIVHAVGQPELRIDLSERRMARYGVSPADANAVVEMAIGGKEASQFYDGERRFSIRVRYLPEFRQGEEEIARLMVPTLNGAKIPLREIATISTLTGPSLIFRDNTERFIAIKFSVRGRDMGSTIEEAQRKVNEAVPLPRGYSLAWAGDFENQQRATDRLAQVVPISLLLIFFILFVLFGTMKDAGLVLLNVPFAITGGIAALLLTGTNFSISAGIGFIALFGICIQDGVILITVFKQNLRRKMPLDQAIYDGVTSRIRPVLMTAMMAAIGLLPAALSTGIGSQTQKPLAIVVIGGLITSTVLTLFIFPLIFERTHRGGSPPVPVRPAEEALVYST